MPLSENWRLVFPYEETRKVVTLIRETWDELVTNKTPKFNPASPEPHLTVFLRAVLKTKKAAVGLTGNFGAEDLDADANLVTGELENRRRADIRYFSDRTDVDLTFEFKKLKPNSSESRLRYYGEQGMLRFVDGKYSRDKHLALMVGLIAESPQKCIDSLKRAIGLPDIAAQLHLLKSPEGVYIHEPSRELGVLVRFDTEHSRAKLGDQPDIVLCHLFLLYGNGRWASDTVADISGGAAQAALAGVG